MVAFASRYGNADPHKLLLWNNSRLTGFSNAVASLLDDEAKAMKKGSSGSDG